MFLLEIWFVGAAALVALLGFILWVLGDAGEALMEKALS
jgi:hypothetical protein